MSPDGKPRRACTLLKAGRGQPTRPMVAKRPLFSYWAILMPHFRGVLLPPQNRSDESIQWAWTETADGGAISGAELATIRKRLAGAQQSLADSLEDASGVVAKAATLRETKSRMDDVVGALVALPDATLAGFVARTERGMLLHSWGLANPLPVQYLDVDFELAGRVIVAGRPAPGHEVLLATADGTSVGQTRTDADGRFEFPKVAAGSYRLRAVSRPPEVFFPEKGELIELLGSAITTIEIRNEDQTRNTVPSLLQGASSGRRTKIVVSAGAALLAVAAYFFWPGKAGSSAASGASEQSAWEVNSAPRSVAQQGETSRDEPKGRSAPSVTAANTMGQRFPRVPSAPKAPMGSPPEQRNSRAADIVVAARASGMPPQPAGLPAAAGGLPAGSGASGAGGAAGGSQAGSHSAGPVGGPTGNAGGAPGPGAGDASTSPDSTPSPPSLPPQVVSPPAATNMAPPAGKPQGSRPPAEPPAGGSAAKAQTGSVDPADAESRPAKSFPTANPPTANTPGKTVAVAEANPAAPPPAVSSSASDLPDLAAPPPEDVESGDKRERSNPGESVSDEGAVRPPLRSDDVPAQASPGITDSDSTLLVRMSFRLPPWGRLLLRDAIVPTLPTRIGQNDALGDLSTRVLTEKQALLPRFLQAGSMVVGIHIEFSPVSPDQLPRWDVAGGSTPLIMTADESAAEIGWRGESPSGQYILTAADGRVIASISADSQSGIQVSCAGRVASWPWVGLEGAPGEAERLGWQILGTVPVPAMWTKNDRWMDGRGRRLDLRQTVEKDETMVLTLAIVDAVTGWALASKVEHQQKLPR